jgi:hypothetical protein
MSATQITGNNVCDMSFRPAGGCYASRAKPGDLPPLNRLAAEFGLRSFETLPD